MLDNNYWLYGGFLIILVVLIVVLYSCSSVRAGENDIRGYLTVIDGDTGFINGEKVRFWGFDAFEKKQTCSDKNGNDVACGIESFNQLRNIASKGEMSCSVKGKESYGRKVVQCFSNGEDVGKVMVRSGWAFDYPQYSNGAYKKDQDWAKRNHTGVHDGMKYAMPWDYRHWSKVEPSLFQKLFGIN